METPRMRKPEVYSPSARRAVLAVGLSLVVALAGPSAWADEAQARSLFKAMSDYLAAQKTLSFDYDTNLEIVTKDEQKLALASSGSITVKRPDKFHARRTGGFADVEMLFDGKTVSLLGKNANAYGQAEIPGTIDNLVDQMRDKYNMPLPGADLLLSDVNGQLMPLVTDVKDLGSGVIRGVECNHLAFRTPDVDWQIWIAVGDRPYPCRYVIATKKVAGFPQYTLDIRNWKTGGAVAPDAFTFKAPPDARKVDMAKLRDMDELSAPYLVGAK
jgi:hypothetical protein